MTLKQRYDALTEFALRLCPGPHWNGERWHCRTCCAYGMERDNLPHSGNCKWVAANAIIEGKQ